MLVMIDGISCEAQKGELLLEVATRNGINIPTLCHHEVLSGLGSCRLCIVEVQEGESRKVVTSCIYPIAKEITVSTNSEKIRNMRRTIISLLAAGIKDNAYIDRLKAEYGLNDDTRYIKDNETGCVLCGLCVKACESVGPCAISTVGRGTKKKVSTPYDEPSRPCVGCGSCASVCPTGAIDVYEKGSERIIWKKRFELLDCEKCGTPFISKEKLLYIRTKTGTKSEKRLCDKCRKAEISEAFRNTFGV